MASTSTGNQQTPKRNSVASRAERDRLRDYYGLGASSSSANDDGEGSSSARRPSDGGSASRYKRLVKEERISGLLKAQSDLLTEIRELDGDRQSLVYNHHTDLVEASETIRKMKAHSDSLSPTLDALSSSFESIAKLSDQLSNVLQPALSPPPQRLQSQSPIDVSRDLIPIATLPRRLRDVIALGRDGSGGADRSTLSKEDAGLPAAEALWGRHEAVLSTWVQANIPGAADIAAECRAVLKEERERIAGAGSSGRTT